MSGTESDILSRIPGLDDGAGDDATDAGTETGNQESQSRSGNEGRRTDQHDDGSSDRGAETGDERKLPEPPVVRRHDGLVERRSQTDARHRDLVDPVTGEVVARGGIERRIFENAQRATRENQQLKQRLTQLEASHTTSSQANTVGNQLGLTPEHQVTAMRVMSDFLRDPVKTVEYMISEVRSKGFELPSLQQAGGMDMRAVQRMLDDRLAPLHQPIIEQRRQEQARQQAQETIDSFLVDVPEAGQNLAVIAEMIQQDGNLDLPRAFIRLSGWAQDNGLDIRQPLGPQIEARQRQPGNVPRQQPRAPLPNGRTVGNGASPMDQRRVFDENSDWGSIIEDSLREAGFSR